MEISYLTDCVENKIIVYSVIKNVHMMQSGGVGSVSIA